eukprot:1440094-Rhodomonas_salina.1
MALRHHLGGASCPSWYQQGLYVIGAQPPSSISINTPLAPSRVADHAVMFSGQDHSEGLPCML